MIPLPRHYRKAIGPFLLLLLSSLLTSCAHAPAPTGHTVPAKRPQPAISVVRLEKQIHLLINKERQKQGLSQLSADDALSLIARRHSRDMAARKYFDHISPEGHDFAYRYRQGNYDCSVATGSTIYKGAENIAQNNLYDSVTTINGEAFFDWNSLDKIAETTVQGWMKSPGHRKNILMPHWNQEGIGVYIAPDDKVYITQNFC